MLQPFAYTQSEANQQGSPRTNGNACASVGHWGCHTVYQIVLMTGAAERAKKKKKTLIGQRGRAH